MKKYAGYVAGVFIAIATLAGLKWGSSRFSTGKADLSWNPNNDPSVAGYKIYYGNLSRTDKCPTGGYEEIIDVGKNTSYRIEKLKRNTVYYFSTTSYNSVGKESCFSDEVSKRVK